MSGFSEYSVSMIKSSIGRDYIVDNHYTGGCHRSPMCWGLHLGDELVGVIGFATPCSEAVRASVFGPDHKSAVTELHRMHLKDPHPRNLTTWFLARALRGLVEYKPLIRGVLSYADATEGHEGTVYRAANALYCGTTKKARFWRDADGVLRHPRQCGVNISKEDAVERGWAAEMRGAKHRYLFLVGPCRRELKLWRGRLILDTSEFGVQP